MSATSTRKAFAAASLVFAALLAVAGGASGGRAGTRDGGTRDRQAPSAPANVRVTSATPTTVALAWDPSTDNIGVTGYYVYINGRRATVYGTTYTARRLVCGKSVAVWIVAFDRADNRSTRAGTIASTAACPDTQPPSTPSGLAASVVTQTSLTLAWSVSSDNVGVTGYDVYRNNTKMATVNSTSSNQTGLACGTPYSFAVEAFDAAGNRSTRAQLNATTSACSPPPPPPPPAPAGCTVDPTTMTAPGCSILRSDTSAVADPKAGLWGIIAADSDSRHQQLTSGSDPRPRADGASQGDGAYRRLTVIDGDDYWGERAQLGRNERRYGENVGTQTSGTFALYRQGERKITFFSQRYGAGFDANTNSWQQIAQMKQAQPYAEALPVGVALEIQIYAGRLRLHTFWRERWSTPAPANNVWVRYALDVVYSTDPAVGKVKLYADLNGDGDALDSGEQSPVITGQTLTTEASTGEPISSALMLGIYHNPVIACPAASGCQVDIDNVQVASG